MTATLRMLTCGSVDDGKSTLIGRLLYETGSLPEDHIAALAADSAKYGTTGNDLDFSLALDGLIAEREQNITIDVAYRYFSTPRRRFIVADSPGHDQYTRNMATAASQSDLGLLLVDARRGVSPQTLRHLRILALMNVRHVVLAVNKIDCVSFSQVVFEGVTSEFQRASADLTFASVLCLPVSARHGDNLVNRSDHTPWYGGPALLQYLEGIDVGRQLSADVVRFPVQLVIRPDASLRAYAGSIAAGTVRCGDEVSVARTGHRALITRIMTFDGDLTTASAGAPVTLVLDRDLDLSRGDLLCGPAAMPTWSASLQADVVWFDERPLALERSYWLKAGGQTVSAMVGRMNGVVEINSGQLVPADTLRSNEIGRCVLGLSSGIAHDAYDDVVATGSFILIDQVSNFTVAAGMIRRGAPNAPANVHWRTFSISRDARARLANQRPCVVWFTGLSGSGKSTVADAVERRLFLMSHRTFVLDGDNVRHGLCRDLGFSDGDRAENIRRVAEVARLFADAGLIVMVALISPFARDRAAARSVIGAGEFLEVFVDAPLAVAEGRDPKGLYRKARQGVIKGFTGVDAPYESPENPDLRLETSVLSVEDLADRVIALLNAHDRLLPA